MNAAASPWDAFSSLRRLLADPAGMTRLHEQVAAVSEAEIARLQAQLTVDLAVIKRLQSKLTVDPEVIKRLQSQSDGRPRRHQAAAEPV